MAELYLRYKDNGDEKRVGVVGEKFIVGRHSESDLAISDGRLSRQHLKIDRFGDVFVASDAGSSNGTKLNGEELDSPAALKHGDVFDLGGVEVIVELVSDDGTPADDISAGAGSEGHEPPVSGSPGAVVVETSNGTASNQTSLMLLLLIPVFGLILLLFGGAIIYVLVSGSQTTVAKKPDDINYSPNDDEDVDNPSNTKGAANTDLNGTGPTVSNGTVTSADRPSDTNSKPIGNLSETAKVEQNGAAFLRRIALNDPRAFLTAEQAQRVQAKIRQFNGSAALAANIGSARSSASQIKALAESKNLKPQFVAVAAIAKLANSRGNVLQTAQGMMEVLDKLSIQLGHELADDSLLIIAAYGQGAAGDTMKMRNMLQDLANKFPESSRVIRTIWFLEKQKKITPAEFDAALTFLAVGTITQNPKDFGVSAEALAL